MWGSVWRRALAVAVPALLAGCAALAPAPEAIAPRPAREDISRFLLSGRVAVRNGEQSFSARVDWRHGNDGSEHVLLSAPLGQGLAELTADRSGARLETADRQSFAAADLDALSEQAFGARLPLVNLPRWALGQVSSSSQDLVLDTWGRPRSFRDGGWRVAYLAYETDTAEALPLLIQLQRDALDVKLKVDRWTIDP